MAFSESWRKRHACERCRRHKVRCEYEDPTSQRCIRCARTNSECVVKERPNRKGGENSPPKTSAENIVEKNTNAGSSEKEPETSPLLKSAHDGIYEFEEMGIFYDLFIKSGNNIPICEPPKTLCELDKLYPLTALTLVTCVALSMSRKNASQRYKLVEGIMSTGMGDRQAITFDSHSALILACQFLLPYGGKGLMRLNLLHGSMLALQAENGFKIPSTQKFYHYSGDNKYTSEVIVRLYEHTGNLLMSYSLDEQFDRIAPVAALYSPMEALAISCDRAPLLMHAIFTDHRTTLAMMEQTSTISDLMNVCAMGYEKLSNTAPECPKALTFSMVARLKLAAAAFNWAIRSLGADNLDPYEQFFNTMIMHSIQFFREHLLVNYQYSPQPVLVCYLASTIINLLWSLRLYCFAANLDIDVPVSDFCDLISARWQAMAAGTYTGRASFVALIRTADLVRFEFGYYSECSQKVEGSGKMDTFYVYLISNKSNPPLYEAAINSADLRELTRFDNMGDRKHIGYVTMIPTSYEEFEEIFSWIVQRRISNMF